jgi:N-acetylglucosaminyldiphosphoundecaprenol N-acetyl-beta-D-mannosaminyltransferase
MSTSCEIGNLERQTRFLVVSDTNGLPSAENGQVPAFTCCSVRIDAHTLESAVDALLSLPDPAVGRAVHLCNAFTMSLARGDHEMRRQLYESDLNLPDGMPLVWIGRRLGLGSLIGRVYGPDLMLATMDRGRELGIRHLLYGSTNQVLTKLETELRRRFPEIDIVGRDAPPFRELNAEEEFVLEQRLADLRPDIVWVGLGTPKQDAFVYKFRERVPAAFVAVGAAFDFISGAKRQAPLWMQDRGLEWAYRLAHEPRRLGSRYLVHNARFVTGVIRDRPKIEQL